MAVSLSAVTKNPVEIVNIRSQRRQPGLAAQHLSGVQLVKDICLAAVDGAYIQSTNILFAPSVIKNGNYLADTKTAGSIALLLQVSLPCCLFSNDVTSLTLRGGTNAEMAPPIEYTINVLLPTLQKLGVNCDARIKRRGFYPAGRGEVYFHVRPVMELMAINLINFGSLVEILVNVYYAGKIPRAVAERMAHAANHTLRNALGDTPVRVEILHLNERDAYGSGFGINLLARTSTGCLLAASQIGRPRVDPETVADVALKTLLDDVKYNACVDQYMQDQLIIYMALATGVSALRTGPLTLHTQTAIHVAEQITLAKFKIDKLPDGATMIECTGIGLKNPNLTL